MWCLFPHVVQGVCSLYRYGVNMSVILYLVYNTWTGAVITSFLVPDFRVPYNYNYYLLLL